MSSKPNGQGLGRIIKAAHCSFAGIKYAFQHEAAFRQELILCIVMLPLAFLLTESAIERVLLIAPLILLLTVECINSAIEAAIDRISLDIHPLSKQAKDLGSAAVFFIMILIVLSWTLVLWDKISQLGFFS